MSALRFDLQSHSHHSDGVFGPEEVVARAAAAGVELLALSDHDTVGGVAQALAAGRAHGVRVIPAVEVTVLDGDRQDLHLLGYGIDHEDPSLLALLAASRSDRDARAGRMAEALRQRGWALDEKTLKEPRANGRSIGRPHLAAAVFAHPDNAGRLREVGLANPTELLVAELVEGAPSHRGRTRPTITEAIAAIHAAGGVAVWAHPFWDIEEPGEVLETIDRFVAQGLDGVEAFYITHTREQTQLLAQACAQRRLLSTGSADFHGPDHPRFSAFGAFELHGCEPNLGPLVADAPAGKHPAMRIWQRDPLNAEPAPDLLANANITALNVFYVRSHGPTPAIDRAAHRLTIAGLVEEPLELSLDEISGVGPRRSVVATLQCAGNRRRELLEVRPIEGEIPWGPGVIGTAVWTGVPLVDVLARAGVQDAATHIELIGGDLDLAGRQFGGSIPLAKARSAEVLLATHMNGEPLTAAHGAPLRAVVPGYVGARSVKWLWAIRALAGPSQNHYQAVAYRVHPPSVTDREADPTQAIQLGEVAVNAAILTPGDGTRLPAGEVVVNGYAISGGANRIERVDVTTDGGVTWRSAELLDPASRWAWRRWRLTLELPAGDVEIVARAVDSSVNTQPENPAHLWNVHGYANNARPRVRLRLV